MLQLGQPTLPPASYGLSFWLGTTLIIVGVAVNILSVRHHLRLVDDLNRGGSAYMRPSSLAIVVALILALIGAVMATYLISFGESQQTRQEKALLEKNMTPSRDNGIVSIPSSHTVDQTVKKLETLLRSKGVKLFALIDHSGEAEKAGMQMRPTKLLIFGNPKAGTPLMVASPGIAIDLPLKILVAEDASGKVQVSWNNAAWLQVRGTICRRNSCKTSPLSKRWQPKRLSEAGYHPDFNTRAAALTWLEPRRSLHLGIAPPFRRVALSNQSSSGDRRG